MGQDEVIKELNIDEDYDEVIKELLLEDYG